MRTLLGTGVAVCFTLALLQARADDAADARVLIGKAIKATGGKDKLAQFKAQTFSEKGTYYGMGQGQPYTGKYAVQWPDKFRMEIKDVFTSVFDGDKGWVNFMGETKEMTREQLANQRESSAAQYATTLLPLEDKSYTLTTLPEIKVDGKPALGVKAAKKGMPDVSLYFDKATGLLIKYSFRTKSEEEKGKEVTQDVYLSDFHDVQGVQISKKVVIKRDDKQFIESDVFDVKLLEKLDDKVFAKP
jgi:outer membrane lipoprotein-sorting protein